MSLAFWNNPLVVSAFRVRVQRASPFGAAVKSLAALAVVGAVLEHYHNDWFKALDWPWTRTYFLTLMAVQFLVSGLIAVTATSSSLRAEVMNRTLDMQRIAALTPRQILLGKLLGEPATAYLLAVVSVPLGVFCWITGGVPLDLLLLMYLNLATNTLLLGSLGLLMRVEPGTTGRRAGPEVFVLLIVVLSLFLVPLFVGVSQIVLNVKWLGTVLGFFTPVPAFYALVRHDTTMYSVSLFGTAVPAILLAPLGQLLLALVCFRTMVRQLMNPLYPSFGKPMAYVVLGAVDVVTGGVLSDPGPGTTLLETRTAAFWMVHALASLYLIGLITPWKESLFSWSWRVRGRRPWLADWWLGNRSDNVLALFTFCVIGLVMWGLCVVLPAAHQYGTDAIPKALPVLATGPLLIVVLTMAAGLIQQWIVFVAGRAGQGLVTLTLAVLIGAPHAAGYYFEEEWLLNLSPSYQMWRWFNDPLPLTDLVPVLLLYTSLAVAAGALLRRREGKLARAIDAKLRQMGVPPALRPAGAGGG
jgi:hypothetical protein